MLLQFLNFVYIFFITLVWVVYLADSTYLNIKMKQYFGNGLREVFLIPFYIFILAIFGIIASDFSLLFSGKFTTYFDHIKFAGALFCLAAILLFNYVIFFEKSFPSCLARKEKRKLVGIYKYIRHPSYWIFFLITFGTALYLENTLLFALALINHGSLYLSYMFEENQAKKTNKNYAEYLKKTHRFLPRFF